MVRAFVSIGSNMDPAENVQSALRHLAGRLAVTRVSTVYRTEPEGRPEQSSYYNCVIEIETDLSPLDLKFRVLRPIEALLKRERTSDKFAPRTIDLDLILYGDLVSADSELILPDPEIVHRYFLAEPLAELAPDLVLPGYNFCIRDVAAQLASGKAQPLRFYTDRVRQEIVRSVRDGK